MNAIIFSYYLIFLKPKIYLIVVFSHSEHFFYSLLVSFYNLLHYFWSAFSLSFRLLSIEFIHISHFALFAQTAKQQNNKTEWFAMLCKLCRLISARFPQCWYSSNVVLLLCCSLYRFDYILTKKRKVLYMNECRILYSNALRR